MGRDKALLQFGSSEVLLERVVRLVGEVVPRERIVCVAAADQSLPLLPSDVQVVRDAAPQQGPLAGLATGIDTLAGLASVVFVCGCDTPHLVPAFVARMFDLLAGHQVAAVHDGQRFHPLAAVYRADVLPIVESLLAAGERRLSALVERVDTRRVEPSELSDLDPKLASLANCNTVEEYQRLLALAFSPSVES